MVGDNASVASSYGFIDLLPIDNAKIQGSYEDALKFALESPRINNIAITGPYGSGKSSIIKTFEKISKCNFLNISLATFKEDTSLEDGNDVEPNILIERSILQQMLYCTDANKLPYSRFKRIAVPKHPLIKSIVFALWVLGCWLLYTVQSFILTCTGFWYIALSLLIGFIVALPTVLISDLYKFSFGVSFKKFSLKNMEIERGDISEKSILNRHLDEIIYFFQVMSYDVVVFEDLDRFGSPEIFVKLREINKLINGSKKVNRYVKLREINKLINGSKRVNRHVKFLYALKDDMFVHKQRAKFFDFIIPIVPVINSSNSLDKMQDRLEGEPYADKINSQFLREVSLYLDDLRLIHNVFNEFTIYYKRLGTESLDATKLLAMMIYKNVYPNDFEQLHYGKGALVKVCCEKNKLLFEIKEKSQSRIAELRSMLKDTDQEIARNVQDLINSYIGHLVLHVTNGSCVGIRLQNGQNNNLIQLKEFEQFKQLFDLKNVTLIVQHSYNQQIQPLDKSFKQIEAEINPNRTFLQRKQDVERKTAENRKEIQLEINKLNREISELVQLSLNQLLREKEVDVKSLLSDDLPTDSNLDLLVYLIREGYLDENYSIYISNFYEGRLTLNDREFLLTIRNRNKVDPMQQIDTPDEVCKNMRPEDFSQRYVLNTVLMDYLIQKNLENIIQTVLQYISRNFEDTEEFFAGYYDVGKMVPELISALSKKWPDFFTKAIDSSHAILHISSILRYAHNSDIVKMNEDGIVSNFLSERGNLVFATEVQPPEDYDLLKQLGVKFMDLESLIGNKPLLDYVHEECLYVISSENIKFLVNSYGAGDNTLNPMEQNYTTIISSGSEHLKNYITANLSIYIDNVFLALPENSHESGDAIFELIASDELSDDRKEKIITKEDHIFDSLNDLPESLWLHLLVEEKVVISWENISTYLELEDCDKDSLTALVTQNHLAEQLSSKQINKSVLGKERSTSLSTFILTNNDITDSAYEQLIKAIPYCYEDFPSEISKAKMRALIKEHKVILTEDSFNSSQDNKELLALLISKRIDEYLLNKENYPITDSVREWLLAMELKFKDKISIALDVTLEGAEGSEKLASLLADLLKHPEIKYDEFDDEIISLAIVNSSSMDDSLLILTKCIPNWSESFTMSVLEQLPEPYCKIATYGKKQPKLPMSETNHQFALLLKTMGFISSFKEDDKIIRIYTYESADHSD